MARICILYCNLLEEPVEEPLAGMLAQEQHMCLPVKKWNNEIQYRESGSNRNITGIPEHK